MDKRQEYHKTMTYTVIVCEDHENGGYIACVPTLGTCASWAATKEEAFENALDAIESFVGSYRKHGEPVPLECESRIVNV